SLSMLGDRVLARMHTLRSVDVASKASCTGGGVALRSYQLRYLPDADTHQPRLQSVQLLGRAGTPEGSTPVPVASYTYGTASNGGTLRYQQTRTLPVYIGELGSTNIDAANPRPLGIGIGYSTYQSLLD